MKLHQVFLDQAKEDQDTLKQIYGHLYLYFDCIKNHDFTEATRHVLDAEMVARASDNLSWLGWVTHRKGALHVYVRNFEEALQQYELSAELCGQGQDSLCLAINLEQISSMYGQLRNFEKAQEYFELATPLLEKFGGPGPLAVALANYGALLTYQKRGAEALPYFERALKIYGDLNLSYKEVQCLNNIGQVHAQLKQYEKAREVYEKCIEINLKNDWPERVIYNYFGLSEVYRKKHDFQEALLYLKKYHSVKDSIMGMDTQRKISKLEAKYDKQDKELALQKSRAELIIAERSIERGVWAFFFLMLAGALGAYLWKIQTKQAKRKMEENEENLKRLTRILLKKNALLSKMERKIVEESSQANKSMDQKDFEDNIFNKHILTDEDWSAFKIYFEKTYPGYLSRLRAEYPDMTEAEERLSLFIKLNLTRKEAAAILGINVDSVKKTRYRVRKRLGLDEKESLDDFIRNF